MSLDYLFNSASTTLQHLPDMLNSLNLARQKLEVIEEKVDFINTYGNQ